MAYTPTVYTNDASSPDLDATNLNKSEQGIKDAHLISVPVDCSSRVAEYTGDGIPLIPDNMAGTTYRSDFATTDGWYCSGGSLSVANGKLLATVTAATPTNVAIYRSFAYGSNKLFRVMYKSPKTGNVLISGTVNGVPNTSIKTVPYTNANIEQLMDVYIAENVTAIIYTQSGMTIGDVISISSAYIGTGAYDTPALDRAGNGNSLALNAVTPVNGKFCKEMSFNGLTSYAQASSPVIGATGTVAIRFKINSTSATYFLFDTRNSSTYLYGMALAIVSNVLSIRFAGSTEQSFNLVSGIGTGYRTVEIAFDATNIYFYLDGALISTTAITVSGFTHTNNLLLGKGQITSTPAPLNGIISHFRYDSRVWTADEARAWSLNPISIDSRV